MSDATNDPDEFALGIWWKRDGDGWRNATGAECAAEILRLRAGIYAILTGDYDNPRRYRPEPCRHHVPYCDVCERCLDAALERVLRGEKP